MMPNGDWRTSCTVTEIWPLLTAMAARGKPPASTTSKRYVRELPVAPLDW
ncbi:MAG: hypothetical protein IJJ84_05715 [Kiritimatiellae bacterium]|nr:hypothetical protein [Kiritimatiellia bacterium]